MSERYSRPTKEEIDEDYQRQAGADKYRIKLDTLRSALIKNPGSYTKASAERMAEVISAAFDKITLN